MTKVKIFLINIVFTIAISYFLLFVIKLSPVRFFVLIYIIGLFLPFFFFHSKKIKFWAALSLGLLTSTIILGLLMILFTLDPFLLAGF